MTVPQAEKQVARKALRDINPASRRQNVEYGLFIYRLHGTFHAAPPFTSNLRDGLAEIDITDARRALPRGAMVTAFAHTHAANDAGEFALLFSPEDLEFARSLNINAYMATPTGSMVIFDRTQYRDEFPREPL